MEAPARSSGPSSGTAAASAARCVVLASGSGSNLQAILDAIAAGQLNADVVAVVSDRVDAYALQRAQRSGVPAVHCGRHDGESRTDYDRRLAAIVSEAQPDWVVLAGWMRLLSMSFLGHFPQRVLNLHPALPGELAGTHAIERAFNESKSAGRTSTGVMIHLVPDEGVDNGPVVATTVVPIHPDDTLADLETRIHAAEHRLLVDTLRTLCADHPQGAHA